MIGSSMVVDVNFESDHLGKRIEIKSVAWRGIVIFEALELHELDEIRSAAFEHIQEEIACAAEREADRMRDERLYREAA